MASQLRIEPIASRHLDDLDLLFARGDPRHCQCAFMRLTNTEDRASTPAQNRSLHHAAIRRAEAEGGAAGLIAYDDEGPVGWVSFGPREDFGRLANSTLLAPVDDKQVTSVVCFVVAARARRKGVGTELLDAVIDYARDHHLTLLEAYPIDHAGQRRPGADLWRGTLSMFEAAGFTEVAAGRQNAKSPRRSIMRRRIRPR
jgi:GNAT superfamily N-acetyltransferase